ncbi:DUF1090 domain-containing protein [Comamonas sp. lk]|uniref:DUF1090 domain-containing protein n=1 Tax=Comamonas sp. lk TaxID=2201272 RepID=UPI000EB5862B|nr:DUF1090 domain-containing protein [Comamonas sp. lk]
MRTSVTLIAIAFSALAAHSALAQPVHATCESKRAEISRDLEHAKAKGQVSRVRGLEKALRENEAHCSDAKLEQEHAARIAEQEKKVERRQRDLDDARATGKASKIADREAKLAKEKTELEKLRS